MCLCACMFVYLSTSVCLFRLLAMGSAFRSSPCLYSWQLQVKRMFSPTNSYLSVTYSEGGVGETVFVDDTIELAIRSTVPDVDVFYVAISRGKIIEVRLELMQCNAL